MRTLAKVNGKKQQASLEKGSSVKRSFNFIGEVKTEFNKITWTEKSELIAYTKIVTGGLLVFGTMVFFADLVIKNTLELIAFVLRVFGG